MNSRARLVIAQLVVVSATAVGFTSLAEPASAEPVEPLGGCWVYMPEPVLPPIPGAPPAPTPPVSTVPVDLAEDPAIDHSSALEPWSVDPAEPVEYTLTTSGATAFGASRSLRLEVPETPILSPLVDATGTATFHFSVAGPDLDPVGIDPVTVDFEAEAGEPLEELVAEGTFPVPAAGELEVTLRAVFFDMPLLARRVACNGQTDGVPGGVNPATTPLDTNITSTFTSVTSSGGMLNSVTGQQVVTAARAGDRLVFTVTGFASGAGAGTASLCSGVTCVGATPFTIDPLGTGAGDLVVPATAAAGAWTLRLTDGVQVVTVPITVLGAPAVAVDETSGTRRSVVTVEGTGWDPARDVTLSGLHGSELSDPSSEDEEVVATAAADGTFSARFVVEDTATESVSALQLRSDGTRLSAISAVEGPIAPGAPPEDEPEPEEPNTPPTATPTTPGSTTVVVPPVTIPLPAPLPIDNVDQPLPPGTVPEPEMSLEVSEARLSGSADLGELFGGAPDRNLVFEVENVGVEAVTDPPVAVAVGRSSELEPLPVPVDVGTIEPGESVTVEVPVGLPAASFGTYQVVGQVGDAEAGAFSLSWQTYPYGLFLLNLIGAALVAIGVRRRLANRPSPRLLPAPVVAASLVPPLNSEAVVDLARLESWWAIKDKGVRPQAKPLLPTLVAAIPAPARPGGRAAAPAEDAVVDLEAADLWWRRQIDTSGAGLEDAIVDLEAAEKWWSQSREGASARG